MPARTIAWAALVLAPLAAIACGEQDPLSLDARRELASGRTPDRPTLPYTADPSTGVPSSSEGGNDSGIAPEIDSGKRVADAAADAVDAARPATAVSDLTYEVVVNGYGPAEKDMSNGGNGANDGAPLKIGGVVYPKGLGVHARSEINVPLAGQYATFLADVGIDDEVGEQGSVVFRVFADGQMLYDSGTVTGAMAAKTVSVNVAGKQELKLEVTDGADGSAFDHADWAGARVVK